MPCWNAAATAPKGIADRQRGFASSNREAGQLFWTRPTMSYLPLLLLTMKTPKLQTVAEYCRHGNRSLGIQNKNEQEVMYMIAFRLAVLVAPVIQKGGTSKAVECLNDLNYFPSCCHAQADPS